MDAQHLPYFINEELYIIPEKGSSTKGGNEASDDTIPKEQTPFAFFHSSTSKEELELLMKIIGACNLEEFKVFDHLDLSSVDFKKGVVFSTETSDYYQVVEKDGIRTLYSKPLSLLLKNVEDKSKLWKSLQALI